MPLLSAFVARSFAATDEQRIRPVLNFLESFKKVGFLWESAEPAEVESVSAKVQRMIDERDVFIGFFTRRHAAWPSGLSARTAWDVLRGKVVPEVWSAPPWVLQESGYALHGKKKLILLRENGVEVFGLQGDLEYVPFNPQDLTPVFSKLSAMINGLLAQAAGEKVSVVLTHNQEGAGVAMEATVSKVSDETLNEAEREPDFI